MPVLLGLALLGCDRSRGLKEAPITGKPSDPPLTMKPRWEGGRRYLYRVDASTSAMIPRRTTGKLMRADTTLGQDLAFTVTNAAANPDGRVIRMELLAVQMETARDDGVTMTFDSDNPAIFVEDSALSERLQKLVGLKMTFFVSDENKVTRVDGMRDLSDRMSGSSVRGVAGNVLSRFFNQQFYRDIIEMGLLPRDPVKVRDSWTVSRQVNGGLWNVSAQLDLSYQFRGWQRRNGTNCARIEFSGTLQPPGTSTSTNQAVLRRPSVRPSSSTEEGTVAGQCWYNPDLALAVETSYQLSLTSRSRTVRRPPNPKGGGTNRVVLLEVEEDPGDSSAAKPMPGAPPPPTNVAAEVTTTTTSTSQWHTTVRLLEIEPL